MKNEKIKQTLEKRYKIEFYIESPEFNLYEINFIINGIHNILPYKYKNEESLKYNIEMICANIDFMIIRSYKKLSI